MPTPSAHIAAAALLGAAGALALIAAPAAGSAATRDGNPPLAEWFGFTGLEIVRIGKDCGPMIVADADGDGLLDILVANDRESRIEIHRQDPSASPDREPATVRVNEFPEHWRFDRQLVPVRHAIGSMAVADFDEDGRPDLAYVGNPSEIVFLRQTEDGRFDVERRHRRRGLSMSPSALAVADVLGDERTELLAIVRGEIHVYDRDGFDLGTPRTLAAGDPMVAMRIADLNGDGQLDVIGLLADDPAPVRLWTGEIEQGRRTLGAQQRFELSPIADAKAVRLPDGSRDLLATVELQTRRVVLQELATTDLEAGGDRDAAYTVRSYSDPDGKRRETVVVDLDGDGHLDLLTTDVDANALSVHRQTAGRGLAASERHPTLSDVELVVAGNVDDDPQAEIFVLSGDEELVGRVDVALDGGRIELPFPRPLTLPASGTPVTIGLIRGAGNAKASLLVVQEDKRIYTASFLSMDGTVQTLDLGKLSREPSQVLAADVDQDGHTDVLLLIDDREPILLRARGDDTETGDDAADYEIIAADAMGQVGLVKAAGRINTGQLDVDGDGRAELLIADGNYVRAVRYDEDPGAGISPGWQVVLQVNAEDTGARLAALAIDGDRIVAADAETDALVVMDARDGDFRQHEVLTVRGFDLGPIFAGRFSGDDGTDVLSAGSDGFAVIRFGGRGTTLRTVSSWQPDDERRRPHELGVGDVNGDGFVDLVALDAAEQQCDILTLDGRRELQYATGFAVFESRLFSGGSSREYEPSQAIIADVTGDGAADLILLAHDRILLYPQMTAADSGG